MGEEESEDEEDHIEDEGKDDKVTEQQAMAL